jgi:hypothetical protein
MCYWDVPTRGWRRSREKILRKMGKERRTCPFKARSNEVRRPRRRILSAYGHGRFIYHWLAGPIGIKRAGYVQIGQALVSNYAPKLVGFHRLSLKKHPEVAKKLHVVPTTIIIDRCPNGNGRSVEYEIQRSWEDDWWRNRTFQVPVEYKKRSRCPKLDSSPPTESWRDSRASHAYQWQVHAGTQ